MAIYTAGRRRTMIILLLSSVLLITLDLRGNAVFNAARSGFGYAIRPFEIAGEVVTRPASRVWRGMTEVDELEAEVDRLQELVDRQRSAEVAGDNALIENQELRALAGLESLASLDQVTASIIGQSPSNQDQRVEIDRGSGDGIRVGMPVINSAGLVGKVTQVYPETAVVMLVTDPLYHVPVKVVAEVVATPETIPEPTVPSGLAVDDVTTTTSTSTTTTTTLPGATTTIPQYFDADGNPVELPIVLPSGVTTTTVPAPSTTTTTSVPIRQITRETGVMDGLGADLLPRVRFIADSQQFGVINIGDAVLTAGGSASLAPPNLPIGRVVNKIEKPGTEGVELEVELNADLDRLNFLTVVLFVPPTEASSL